MSRACKICKVQVHQWANYCNSCAFAKGICARCGRKVSSGKHHVRHDASIKKAELTVLEPEEPEKEISSEEEDKEVETKGSHTNTASVTMATSTTNITEEDPWQKLSDARGNTYYYNPFTNKTSWTKPSPDDSDDQVVVNLDEWKETKDPSGRTYYWNVKTNETSWSLPKKKK